MLRKAKQNIQFSIIIPFQKASGYLAESLFHISKLRGITFEVILLPDDDLTDDKVSEYDFQIKIAPTGSVSPAIKRDMGSEVSEGNFLAFIDDDAYPTPDWLKNAIVAFSLEDVVAVCGPQITPQDDGFWQKVSGAMFLSPLNGKSVCRYWPCGDRFYVDDWPSVNLIVKKEAFERVGGFDSAYWPGEDTKLCLDLTKKLKKKILYVPELKVYHHRRAGFIRHLKQIGNYGMHRGFFAKKFPETSLRLSYFIPSFFFLFVILGWVMLLGPFLAAYGYIFLWLVYMIALCFSTVQIYRKIKDISVAVATIPYLVSTHFWYGWRFIKGFIFVFNLKSKLGR
ncbi:MAG: glycosyltransferase [Desulfobacterales bacterium]|nr:glycosyltransferase [Desulfobacterales bacterium]